MTDENRSLIEWLTKRVLWLGTFILAIIAASFIYLGSMPRDGSFLSDLFLGLGVNFATGALGTALYEILIQRPQRGSAKPVTADDVASILEAVNRTQVELTTVGRAVDGRSGAEVLDRAGVAVAFPNRRSGYRQLREALQDKDLTQVRILGITLSEFISPAQDSPWQLLQHLLLEEFPRQGRALHVEVLVCDPRSLGLRLISPHDAADHHDERFTTLKNDLANVLSKLNTIENQVKSLAEQNPRAKSTFEYRISGMVTQNFLFATDTTAFIQSSYLGSAPPTGPDIPMLKYRAASPIQEAAIRHFDTLWVYAAAKPGNHISNKPVRLGEGAALTGLMEVFASDEEALDQMVRLLGSATRRVWIQGISNIPIFGDRLSVKFKDAAFAPGVEVRVLILDPDSRVAKQKTFARYDNSDSVVSWESYCDDGAPDSVRELHNSSHILVNIKYALRSFSEVAKRANLIHGPDKMLVRLCQSVEGFVLLVDDHVLVEPYHYGDESNIDYPGMTQMQLAANMPLLEFHEPHPAPFPLNGRRRSPVKVYESHFERVFKHFSTDVPDDLTHH